MAPIIKIIEEVVVPLLRIASVIFLSIIVLAVLSMVWSMPIHNAQLWWLEKNFKATVPLYHPAESILLQEKKYLGGPYDHGGQQCSFFVGELRSAALSKEEIRHAYSNREIPFQVLFFDEDPWKMELPLTSWWDEWYENPLIATTSTAYFVFAAQEGYPFLGDLRCDD